MDSQNSEPDREERNEAEQTPAEADSTVRSTNLESITWKGRQLAEDLISGDGIRFDRLTQLLANALSRRRLGGLAAASLAGLGLQLQAETVAGKRNKKKQKKKKKKKGNGHSGATCTPACGDGFSCNNGACACPSNVICEESCCASGESCTDRACCPGARICNGQCCVSGESCHHGVCCSDPISIRGESCCPTGGENAYFCGRFKCFGFLTGVGPGGCDWWCDPSQEGGLCGPGVDGIPTGEGNGRACCCTEPGTEICVWPD